MQRWFAPIIDRHGTLRERCRFLLARPTQCGVDIIGTKLWKNKGNLCQREWYIQTECNCHTDLLTLTDLIQVALSFAGSKPGLEWLWIHTAQHLQTVASCFVLLILNLRRAAPRCRTDISHDHLCLIDRQVLNVNSLILTYLVGRIHPYSFQFWVAQRK